MLDLDRRDELAPVILTRVVTHARVKARLLAADWAETELRELGLDSSLAKGVREGVAHDARQVVVGQLHLHRVVLLRGRHPLGDDTVRLEVALHLEGSKDAVHELVGGGAIGQPWEDDETAAARLDPEVAVGVVDAVGYEACLKENGFTDGSGEIHPAKRRRMLNMDETHHHMSNAGESKGPRANVVVDKRLGRSGRRQTENSSHITGMHWADYEGEVGAGMYLFDSSASEAEDRRIRASWIHDLPSTRGFFGFNELTTVSPSVAVTPKGGTVQGTLQQFVETQIYTAYPNISPDWELEDDLRVVKGPVFMQVDSGPTARTTAVPRREVGLAQPLVATLLDRHGGLRAQVAIHRPQLALSVILLRLRGEGVLQTRALDRREHRLHNLSRLLLLPRHLLEPGVRGGGGKKAVRQRGAWPGLLGRYPSGVPVSCHLQASNGDRPDAFWEFSLMPGGDVFVCKAALTERVIGLGRCYRERCSFEDLFAFVVALPLPTVLLLSLASVLVHLALLLRPHRLRLWLRFRLLRQLLSLLCRPLLAPLSDILNRFLAVRPPASLPGISGLGAIGYHDDRTVDVLICSWPTLH